MRILRHFRGLAAKTYAAFLIAAAAPVTAAGLIGIYYSLDALKQETLRHLDHEVTSRATGIARLLDQVTREIIYLASSPLLHDLANNLAGGGGVAPAARQRLERDYATFARSYHHAYQVRVLDESGMEVVRVDRRDDRIYVVPEHELQNKAGRYYFNEGFSHEPGQVYVSRLDLNIEHGKVEIPERPVIRFATPIADRKGHKRGLLVINVHAEVILEQIQEMAGVRGGIAYLFDHSGFYLSRGAREAGSGTLTMESAEALVPLLSRPLLARILQGTHGAEVIGDWIVAFAPIVVGTTLSERTDSAMDWAVASTYPRARLFEAVFNLYLLYGVLGLCLTATALGGYALSRHLLRPLTLLKNETEEIARGNFSNRVEIRGGDEITELGARFNSMAAQLERFYQGLADQKERLEAEVGARTAALERERRNLAMVIESTADGILALGPDGAIELANSAAERLLGGGAALVGRRFSEFWEAWGAFAAGAGARLRGAQPLEFVHAGHTLSASVAAVAPRGSPEGFIVVVRDVSEERRLQEHRRELDRHMFQMEKMTTMGELAMGLAHEIGNPLAGMKAVVQMLLEQDTLPADQRSALERIHGEVNRLAEFLRTFHGFAAPQEMHPVACRLESALEDVLLWTRKEATSRGVVIRYAPCGERVPALWADPGQLKQVLLNLVINAVQAMPEGGRIEIGMCAGIGHSEDLEGELPRMRVCVRDTGPGIEPEVLPRIFEPFFTTRRLGSGLGLAVVKKIAVMHGADIYVKSKPGKGTTFELVWPIAPLDARELRQLREAAGTTRLAEAAHG